MPEAIKEPEIYYPVGNEWVAVPEIGEVRSVQSFNVLSERHKGMLEVRGGAAPLLKPLIEDDGVPLAVKGADWGRLEDWIPSFELNEGALEVKGTIFAPGDFRGFV